MQCHACILPPLLTPLNVQGADAVEAAAATHSVAAVEAAADEFVQPLVQVTAQLRRQYCERAMAANTRYVQDTSQRLAKLLLLQVPPPPPPPPLFRVVIILWGSTLSANDMPFCLRTPPRSSNPQTLSILFL
jgi:hypothetical protein